MYVFLQGERGIGKSTVISKTLEILANGQSIRLGGFYTWNGGRDDPNVYIKPAQCGETEAATIVAKWNKAGERMDSVAHAFEQEGVRLLSGLPGADLIIMDELGYLESNAPGFKQAVLDVLNSNIPVFGVLRLGDVPWHVDIKSNPLVELYDVNEKNRDELPRELAERLKLLIRNSRAAGSG